MDVGGMVATSLVLSVGMAFMTRGASFHAFSLASRRTWIAVATFFAVVGLAMSVWSYTTPARLNECVDVLAESARYAPALVNLCARELLDAAH
jgi:hypothetical protein